MHCLKPIRGLFGLRKQPASRVHSPKASITSRTRGARRLALESLDKREVMATAVLATFDFGNTAADTSIDFAIDSHGNRFMAGTFSGVIDLAPNVTVVNDLDILQSLTARDAYLAKYDAADNLLWVKQFSTDPQDGQVSLVLDDSGSPVLTGGFRGSLNLDLISLSAVGNVDVFVAKINSMDGSVLWANSWGTPTHDSPRDLTIDSLGNVIVATRTSPLNSLYSSTSIGILKYNSAGAKQWERSMPLTQSAVASTNYVNEIASNGVGGIAITGYLKGTVDFDPSAGVKSISSARNLAYVAKYSSAGSLEWVSTFQSANTTSYSSAAAIAFDASGNLIVGGSFTGTVDFDPGKNTRLVSGGGGYVAKLSATGSLLWVSPQLQTPNSSISTGVTEIFVQPSGSIYASGHFVGTVDFNPGTAVANKTSSAGFDTFVLTLNANGSFGTVDVSGSAGDEFVSELIVAADGTIHMAHTITGTSTMQARYLRYRRV